MAKSKADERTFTGNFYVRRTGGNWDNYEFMEIADYDSIWWELPASMIQEAFRGIARWFRKPPNSRHTFSKRHRVRVTLEVLPD